MPEVWRLRLRHSEKNKLGTRSSKSIRNQVALLLLGVALSACYAPQPFPTERQPLPHSKVPADAWENRVDVLRARGASLKALSGVVQVAIDSPRMSGLIDIVVVHEQPDRTFFQIVKGLRLDARPLYDLTLSGDRYRLDVYDASGSSSPSVGALEDFVEDHQDLAPIVWIRDLMILPEQHATISQDGECPTARTSGRVKSMDLRYDLDCGTLAVLGVRASFQSTPDLELWYDDYRAVGQDLYLPFHIIARDPDGWFHMEAVVVDVEVNGTPPEGVFDIPELEAPHD